MDRRRQLRPTVVDATPSTYHSILRITERHESLRTALHDVRLWCVGGAPLSQTLADDFASAMGLPLLVGYGSSEAGNIALSAPGMTTGCGKPLTGVDVRIVDEDENPVGPGEDGAVRVSTPSLMEGYLAEDGTISEVDSKFYVTGDIGYFDADGNLFVLGRANAVHRFGHTLYPASIEQRAQACGAPVKVVAVDDERKGCELVFLIADPDGRPSRQWQDAINVLLPTYEQPNRVVVLDEYPQTSTGKPDLSRLRQIAMEATQ